MNKKMVSAGNAVAFLGAAFWVTGCFDGGREIASTQPSASPMDQEVEFARKSIEAERAGLPRPARPEGYFTPKEGAAADDAATEIHSVMETTEGTYRYVDGQWKLEAPLAKSSTSSPWGEVNAGSITGLGLVAGSSSAGCPSGWTRIGVDLNRRAGGKWIFLCVQSTSSRGVGLEARDITTFSGGSTYTGNFQLLGGSNGDMNQGAAGAYVYGTYGGRAGLCSVASIGVQTSNIPSFFPPAGWTRLLNGMDLNSGAGGDFIYLVLKVDAVMATPWRNCAGQEAPPGGTVKFPW